MITYDLDLCVGSDNPNKRVTVKCHDTGVNFRTRLHTCRHQRWRDVLEPITIPQGSTAVLKIAKPDKTFCISDGVLDGDSILFESKPQAFTAAGTSEAEVSVFSPEGKRVTTASFFIDVPKECVCDCEKESEPYIDIMAREIKAAKDAADRAEAAAGRAEAVQPFVSVETSLPVPTKELRGKFIIVPTDNTDQLYICMMVGGVYSWLGLNGGANPETPEPGTPEPETPDTTSVLGVAVLGNMILGG